MKSARQEEEKKLSQQRKIEFEKAQKEKAARPSLVEAGPSSIKSSRPEAPDTACTPARTVSARNEKALSLVN